MIDNSLWPKYVVGLWDLPDRTVPAELCDPWLDYDAFDDPNITEIYFPNANHEDMISECFSVDSILAAPLVEVLSVTINNHDANAKTKPSQLQVYGRITVTDGDGSTFTLFDRQEECPELVSADDGSVTLTRTKGLPIHASDDDVKLEILLLDKTDNNNAIIAQGCLYLHYKDPAGYDYGVVRADTVGSAVIRHITYPHAVAATVKVYLESPDPDETVPVYGEIVANFGDHNPCVSLFNKTEDDCFTVKADSSLQLSREVVVLPAAAVPFLTITPDLWNPNTKERIVPKRDACFRVKHHSLQMVDFVIGPHYQIQVHVVWSHPYTHFWYSRLPSSVNVRNRLIEKPLMEVFSVSVCSKDGEGVDVFGSITGCCSDVNSCIWSKDKSSAERLLSNQTLTMTAPRTCFGGPSIALKVNLWDPKGNKISKGCVTSGDIQFNSPIPLNDRQLCSVVPGTIGYAAVHYAVFAEGLLAKVKICLVGNGESSCDVPHVYGSVFTEYSNYKYVTEYQKECYRSKLFLRQFGDSLLLSSDSEVPLTKHVVAVPKSSLLIVDVNLAITSSQTKVVGRVKKDGLSPSVTETFKDRLEFNIDMGCIDLEIPGMHHKMLVSVEWMDAFSEFGQTC